MIDDLRELHELRRRINEVLKQHARTVKLARELLEQAEQGLAKEPNDPLAQKALEEMELLCSVLCP